MHACNPTNPAHQTCQIMYLNDRSKKSKSNKGKSKDLRSTTARRNQQLDGGKGDEETWWKSAGATPGRQKPCPPVAKRTSRRAIHGRILSIVASRVGRETETGVFNRSRRGPKQKSRQPGKRVGLDKYVHTRLVKTSKRLKDPLLDHLSPNLFIE